MREREAGPLQGKQLHLIADRVLLAGGQLIPPFLEFVGEFYLPNHEAMLAVGEPLVNTGGLSDSHRP